MLWVSLDFYRVLITSYAIFCSMIGKYLNHRAPSYSYVNCETISGARAAITLGNIIIVDCSLSDQARLIVENVKQLLLYFPNLILQLSLVLLSPRYGKLVG